VVHSLKPKAETSRLHDAGALCLRDPPMAQLAKDGPLQLSIFDETDLAEFTHPNYPGERLLARRNPLLAPSAPAT
jgi:hypothetical protein